MSTASPARHQAGGASSCPGADDGPDPGAMAQVLSALLLRSHGSADGDPPAAAARAARLILPALTTLRALRPALGTWDGIVHRRCRMRPLRAGPGAADEDPGTASAPPTDGATVVPSWSAAAHGWRTLRVSMADGGTEVTHWLARHDGALPVPGTGPQAGSSAPTAESCAPAATRDPGAPCRVRDATAAPGALPPPGTDCEGRVLLLRPGDVGAWARATGDRNALHLVAGAAARAGLGAGGDDVVAHGTLLGALSLAAAPAPRADLRLVAPAVVPPEGLRLLLAPSGEVVGAGGVLLRRR